MACSSELKRKIKGRLDSLAKKVQELHKLIRSEMPEAYIYFEPESGIHVMERYPEGQENSQHPRVVSSTLYCQFDAGAW